MTPLVVVAVVAALIALGFVLVRKRSLAGGSIDSDQDSKVGPLKTISNTSTDDDNEHSISLQHWISKKAVSNRYESWHIGEIDQGWV